jgi:hypothetical protein
MMFDLKVQLSGEYENNTTWNLLYLPMGVFETPPSILGMGESLRPVRDEAVRGPVDISI